MQRLVGVLTRRTITGLFWTAGGRAAHAGLQLVGLAVMARVVTPAQFGVVSAALVVIGFSAIFSHLGFGPALVQRPEIEQRHLDTAFSVAVLCGLLLGTLMWLGAPAAAEFFRIEEVRPVLRTLAWVFPIQGLGVAADAVLRRELRFQWLANLDIAAYALGYGAVGIGLALAGWGVWALVAGQMAQTLIRSGALLVRQPPRLSHPFEVQAFRELVPFAGGFTVAKAANYLALQGDNLVVGRYLGPQALGFYGRAYGLMSAPASSLGTVLDKVLFPAMAKVQHDAQRLASAYRRGVALIALLVLAPSAALIVLAPEFIEVVLGPGWAAVVAPFQILAFGTSFRTSSRMSDSLARSTGAVYRRAWRQILYAVVVVVGAWVGRHWGVAGVAWGALAALALNFFLMAGLSLSLAGMTWATFWRAHIPAVRMMLVACPMTWITATALRHWSLPPLIVLCGAACTAAATMLVLCQRAPGLFVGPDGLWMLRVLSGFMPQRAGAHRLVPPTLRPSYQGAAVGGAQ